MRLLDTFHKSSVIWWARIQVLLGIVLTVVLTTDLSPWITSPRLLTIYLIVNGVLTEILRRRHTTVVEGHLYPVDRMGNPL